MSDTVRTILEFGCASKLYNYMRSVIFVSGPLMLSMSGHTLMMIADRLFLAAYSEETLAASGPAVFASMTVITFFTGLVFSRQPDMAASLVGKQKSGAFNVEAGRTLVLALVSAVALAAVMPLVVFVSQFSGRDSEILALEASYIYLAGFFGGAMVFYTAFNCIFTALGNTALVFRVNLAGQIASLFFTYALVYGKFGFPEYGIVGSALGTLLGSLLILLVYFFCLPGPIRQSAFATVGSGLRRLKFLPGAVKKGVPVGAHDSADELGNTGILWAIGLLGPALLAANNFNIILNYISVMPIIGLGDGANALIAKERRCGNNFGIRSLLFLTIAAALTFSVSVAFLLRLYGADLISLLNLDRYDSEVRDTTLTVMKLILLYALAFSFSYPASRALQAIEEQSYVLKTRLFLMWMGSVPAAFLIAVSGLFEGYKLEAIWASLSTFEFIIGLVLLLRFWRLTEEGTVRNLKRKTT